MDIDAVYLALRDQSKEIIHNESEGDLYEMACAFQAIDDWIKKGGYLPASWQIAQKDIR